MVACLWHQIRLKSHRSAQRDDRRILRIARGDRVGHGEQWVHVPRRAAAGQQDVLCFCVHGVPLHTPGVALRPLPFGRDLRL